MCIFPEWILEWYSTDTLLKNNHIHVNAYMLHLRCDFIAKYKLYEINKVSKPTEPNLS